MRADPSRDRIRDSMVHVACSDWLSTKCLLTAAYCLLPASSIKVRKKLSRIKNMPAEREWWYHDAGEAIKVMKYRMGGLAAWEEKYIRRMFEQGKSYSGQYLRFRLCSERGRRAAVKRTLRANKQHDLRCKAEKLAEKDKDDHPLRKCEDITRWLTSLTPEELNEVFYVSQDSINDELPNGEGPPFGR